MWRVFGKPGREPGPIFIEKGGFFIFFYLLKKNSKYFKMFFLFVFFGGKTFDWKKVEKSNTLIFIVSSFSFAKPSPHFVSTRSRLISF